MVAGAGIAPASDRLQRTANLSQLPSQKLVAPDGTSPSSPTYQAGALILSYGAFSGNWRKAQDSNLHARLRTGCFQDSCR